jgi:hypothetical protein
MRGAKKPICVFTLAYGKPENLIWAGGMINSFKKFHPNIPVFLFTDKDVKKYEKDPRRFVRMYAAFGKELSKEYETVVQIDNDSIVCGTLNHIFDDKTAKLACPLNNNLIDPKLMIHDIAPQVYVNAGFVMARGERFWEWWDELNHRMYFDHYQYGEQDTLNMIFHYGYMKAKILDYDYKPYWHGLVHKGQWHKFILRGKDIVLPKEEGVCDEDKIIKLIHYAGGQTVKMNFHTFFKPEVVKHLEELISDR